MALKLFIISMLCKFTVCHLCWKSYCFELCHRCNTMINLLFCLIHTHTQVEFTFHLCLVFCYDLSHNLCDVSSNIINFHFWQSRGLLDHGLSLNIWDNPHFDKLWCSWLSIFLSDSYNWSKWFCSFSFVSA